MTLVSALFGQPVTSLSSACAEIYALSDAVKHVRLYRYRALELGMGVPLPLQVQVDNTQALAFAKGTSVNTKLGGTFDMREQWVQEPTAGSSGQQLQLAAVAGSSHHP